jgi:hypothetical protein
LSSGIFYDIRIWEEIRFIVSWKADRLVESINQEIPKDPSLAEVQDKHPVTSQLHQIIEQRANAWVQRLYDICCDAYRSRGKTLSVDFDRAVWFYRVEPFIMGENDSQIHSGTMGGFLNLLLCAVGSPPERRRSLTVNQKECCLGVRSKVDETWHDKLHHLPPRINEAIEVMPGPTQERVVQRRLSLGCPKTTVLSHRRRRLIGQRIRKNCCRPYVWPIPHSGTTLRFNFRRYEISGSFVLAGPMTPCS